ncbi:hypothetical protein BDV96DRAFT_642256 [Lophiotrema nucula]|uniref:SH3 domain-containing protein n=1 Tax=Lophiotrema nucula TaxID=690887 RepID=A0A6A5ZL92_9PLEO|nr:hypothetical protein BDV96DRAFT_642256 [Lophiotrema nucula]
MSQSVSERCRVGIGHLKAIATALSSARRQGGPVGFDRVNDELERFTLWIGNIGALHHPDSPLSLEARLREAEDILTYVLELLEELTDVAGDLSEIVSGQRNARFVSPVDFDEPASSDDDATHSHEELNEENELVDEIGDCVTRLFRVSSLIRKAAPTDLFAKALSKNRYQFDDHFDIAHVGEKFPKLATDERASLRRRLGRAITQRRHYLKYIQDHRYRLDAATENEAAYGNVASVAVKETAPLSALRNAKSLLDSSSRPSTFITKASTLVPGRINAQMIAVGEESDTENDAVSYTTVSRTVDGDYGPSTTDRIPKLEELKKTGKKEIECPFCFRFQKFKTERAWRRHVFHDLRPYVCTFPACDAPFFGNINDWFNHELQTHRVSYLCLLCRGKGYHTKDRYVEHLRRQHQDLLEDGDEEQLIEVARESLQLIPAQDCPCCYTWVDRLRDRGLSSDVPQATTGDVLVVLPNDFKRHLAAHLEQLAMFAIPIGSSIDEDMGSNVAIEEGPEATSAPSVATTLTFNSAGRGSSDHESEGYDETNMSKEAHGVPSEPRIGWVIDPRLNPPFTVQAIYGHNAVDQFGLTFREGQLICVTDILENRFDEYRGHYTDDDGVKHDGVFPKDYVARHRGSSLKSEERVTTEGSPLEGADTLGYSSEKITQIGSNNSRESDDAASESPAPLTTGGTARTRDMRGADAAAQAASRNDSAADQPDYRGTGYGEEQEWAYLRHHRPTRLSDVLEEDERDPIRERSPIRTRLEMERHEEGQDRVSTGLEYQKGYQTADQPDYSGTGYGTDWAAGMRHHRPTRLSDVLEEDERISIRTSLERARLGEGQDRASTGLEHQQDYQTADQPDYSGTGYGEEWPNMRHHRPTRLSDVLEEEDRSSVRTFLERARHNEGRDPEEDEESATEETHQARYELDQSKSREKERVERLYAERRQQDQEQEDRAEKPIYENEQRAPAFHIRRQSKEAITPEQVRARQAVRNLGKVRGFEDDYAISSDEDEEESIAEDVTRNRLGIPEAKGKEAAIDFPAHDRRPSAASASTVSSTGSKSSISNVNVVNKKLGAIFGEDIPASGEGAEKKEEHLGEG